LEKFLGCPRVEVRGNPKDWPFFMLGIDLIAEIQIGNLVSQTFLSYIFKFSNPIIKLIPSSFNSSCKNKDV